MGYNLFIIGDSSDGKQQFTVAISEKQQLKAEFNVGDVIGGTAWTKQYEEREFADFYKAGALKHLNKATKNPEIIPPPWIMMPPIMQVYEERGARLLSKSLWETKCFKCIWANMANVEIQWDFDKNIKKYRFETFCSGPKSCKFYKMGRPRSVPYKNMEVLLMVKFVKFFQAQRYHFLARSGVCSVYFHEGHWPSIFSTYVIGIFVHTITRGDPFM